MLLAVALLTAMHTAAAADSLPGVWQITGEVSGRPLNVTCTIKQAGTALSGSCTSVTDTPAALTGEVKDGKVTFQYPTDYQGQVLTVVYSGTLTSPPQIKGTIEVKPMGAMGTFSAAPAPKKP